MNEVITGFRDHISFSALLLIGRSRHGTVKQPCKWPLLSASGLVQVGSVAGNLMLAHAHPDFPSDVLTIMEAAGATLLIGALNVLFPS